MYIGIIMVCGIVSPAAQEGCTALASNRLYTEESECLFELERGVVQTATTIPEGAYITDAKCFVLDNAS